MYRILEVDGEQHADEIHLFNSYAPKIFPSLATHHLTDGHWWFAYQDKEPVAFAGLVTFEPFPRVAYFKRCLVLADHVGHGLQLRLMYLREAKSRELGYHQIVFECSEDSHSNLNARRSNFQQIFPEQPWGKPGDIYWSKFL